MCTALYPLGGVVQTGVKPEGDLSLFCSILSNVDWSEELLLTAETLGALSVPEAGTLNPPWDAIASALGRLRSLVLREVA